MSSGVVFVLGWLRSREGVWRNHIPSSSKLWTVLRLLLPFCVAYVILTDTIKTSWSHWQTSRNTLIWVVNWFEICWTVTLLGLRTFGNTCLRYWLSRASCQLGDRRHKSTVQYASRPDLPKLAYRRVKGKSPGVVFLPGLGSNMNGHKAESLEEFCKSLGHSCLR